MKILSLKHMNREDSLRIVIIMMMLAALVLVTLPSYVSIAGGGGAESLIGQVERDAIETMNLALSGEYPPLETTMVSWNS